MNCSRDSFHSLLVELVLLLVLLDVVLVSLLEVFGQHDVAVLAHGLHSGLQTKKRCLFTGEVSTRETRHLLADGVDISTADLIWASNVVLQVDVVTQVHLVGDRAEDESLLTSVRKRKLDLAIQTTRSEQSRIQRVGAVGCHDDL